MKFKDTGIREMNQLGRDKIPFFFLIDFYCQQVRIFPLKDLNPKECSFNFSGKTNNFLVGQTIIPPKIEILSPIFFTTYRSEFKQIQKEIAQGNTYLINLTAQTQISLTGQFEDIFSQANAPYKIWLPQNFVCFSPETFIKIENNQISSFPMKGTIDAKIEHARELILKDRKEIAEHYTIVDLIRNDLNLVAKRVRVERFRYIEKIKSQSRELLQVSSEIKGDLPDSWPTQIGTILSKLLPAGSVSGAPKEKTVSIIRDTENYDRGFYTGVAGLFDGKSLDSCVLIRFIENRDGKYFYKSGGGITIHSKMGKEYQELLQKIYIPIG